MRMSALAWAVLVTVFVGAATVVQSAFLPLLAQETTQMQSTTGILVDVNLEARTLRVQAEDGRAWDFVFDDETQIMGTPGGPAGLAANKGVQVTVEYTSEGTINMAHAIQIES